MIVMEPIIQLTREPLDRNALVEAVTHASVGGIVIFEGVVRDVDKAQAASLKIIANKHAALINHRKLKSQGDPSRSCGGKHANCPTMTKTAGPDG